jgi:lipid-binding SYLF domain-containing protein
MKKLFEANLIALALAALFGLTFLAAGSVRPAIASDEPTDQQVLVDQAQIAFKDFQNSPNMQWFRDALMDAKGVLIVPSLFKAGLIFGGSGGKGIDLARDAKTGEWMGPAFYNMGSVTFGLQIGGEAQQVIILAMTDEAVKAMLSPQFKLGADASVAAGPVGIGAAGSASLPVAAFVAFAKSKGVYAGLTVEGTVVTVDKDANRAYYGRSVTPEDILVAGEVSTLKAAALREMVGRAAAGKKCC